MEAKTFPTLYKANSTGSVQFWDIKVEPFQNVLMDDDEFTGEIIIRFGQLGTDSPQETRDLVSKGKNLGKKNATTALEQAIAEAQSKWEKQTKKGYVDSRERAAAKENDLDGVPTMLAHKYSEHAEKITFPAACQPKLDGIRCLTKADGTLWSRSQKPITSVPHIIAAIKRAFPGEVPALDGELYNHSMKSNFEKIVSIVRQTKKVDPEHHLVEYHVYDIALPDGTSFLDRSTLIDETLRDTDSQIRVVETRIVNNHDELMEAFRYFRSLGYEGAMVRNLDSPYVGKRSYDLQKIKEFQEEDFPIVGILEGRGKLQGHVGSFVCKSPNGETFEAKLEGSLDRLQELFTNPALWQGKKLSVKFQGLTTAAKVPRFPVGKEIRDYE